MSIINNNPRTQSDPSSQEIKKSKNWITEPDGQLSLDVYQMENEIVIKSAIAGAAAQDLEISLVNDMLTIKGVRNKDVEVDPKDYYYQECYWGPFSRSIILPANIDASQIKASIKNGILTVVLPKTERIKTEKIEIKNEG